MESLQKSLVFLDPEIIAFDSNNPRGEKDKQIEADPDFEKLKTSIESFGVLEPIVVKKNLVNVGKYVLIDGERRLRASKKIHSKEIPVLIAKDEADGRILAYQIHMLRKNWGKAAETKSIKAIIDDIKITEPNITEKKLVIKLREVTAHSDAEISDLFKLIKYDDSIIAKVLENKIDMSYLVQIEASFINPLKREFPEIVEKIGETNIRNIMVDKAETGLLINTRFLMDKFKVIFKDSSNRKKIKNLLNEFLNDKNISIQKTYDKYEKLNSTKSGMLIKNKKNCVKRNKTNAKKIILSPKQITNVSNLRSLFQLVATDLTKEEYDYIAEALKCIEENCLKAAVVMIWAAMISKIINLVASDLATFNATTIQMANTPKLYYKHFAPKFQKNVIDIDEIRFRSDDVHLLCYLTYKNILNASQFKELKGDYEIRCECAHPSKIALKPNKVISIFEDVYNYIFNNTKVK